MYHTTYSSFQYKYREYKPKKNQKLTLILFVENTILYKNMMNSSSCNETHYIIYVFAVFLLLFSPVFSLNEFREKDGASTTGYKYEKIDRPFVKSIEVTLIHYLMN